MSLDDSFGLEELSKEPTNINLINILTEETANLTKLAVEANYWEAFKRLNLVFMHVTSELEHDFMRGNRPFQVAALLDWIAENKSLIDKIVDGIGAEGYGISPTIYGVSLSVSFGTGVIEEQSITQAVGRAKKASMLGAKNPKGRVGTPNKRAM
jgi:hypothetical protein